MVDAGFVRRPSECGSETHFRPDGTAQFRPFIRNLYFKLIGKSRITPTLFGSAKNLEWFRELSHDRYQTHWGPFWFSKGVNLNYFYARLMFSSTVTTDVIPIWISICLANGHASYWIMALYYIHNVSDYSWFAKGNPTDISVLHFIKITFPHSNISWFNILPVHDSTYTRFNWSIRCWKKDFIIVWLHLLQHRKLIEPSIKYLIIRGKVIK